MRLALTALLACGLLAGASGCGGTTRSSSSSSQPSASSPAAGQSSAKQAPAVRYSAAKRRYLTHFKTDCRRVDGLATASSSRLAALIGQIQGGDPRALRRLTVYLHGLAGAFQQGLRQTRALGPPPEPDARFGQAYLTAAAQIVGAIGHLGDAVARLDARGVGSATQQLKTATTSAQAAAARYGFPTCGKSSSSPSLPGPAV